MIGIFKQEGAVCQELILQVQIYSLFSCIDWDSHAGSIRDISARIHSLGISIDATATRMMGENRDTSAPAVNMNFFSSFRDQGDNNTPLDFLGRTIVHQLIDSPNFWNDCPNDLECEPFINAKSVQIQDRLGRTMLHLLCQKGAYYCIKEVLETGADPSATTIFGHLPLHYAAQRGDLDICELLLEYEELFDIDQKDNLGGTAIVYATRERHTGVEELLIKFGAHK